MKPISIQLYSLREQAEKDFLGVLKKVADIGYKYVEPAGFWNMKPGEFKKVLGDLGLGMVSSHTPWAHSVTELGKDMETAAELGLDKIVCGYGPDDFKDMDAIKRTAENTCRMQEILAKNGFTLFQHNHGFEFQRLDGRLKYDIYRELCPKVKYEIDCFWSSNNGTEDPVAMLKEFAGDTILIHMKDGTFSKKVVNQEIQYECDQTPVGTGIMPVKELVEALPEQVEAIVVELDFCKQDMLYAVEQSYNYLISNGFAEGNK